MRSVDAVFPMDDAQAAPVQDAALDVLDSLIARHEEVSRRLKADRLRLAGNKGWKQAAAAALQSSLMPFHDTYDNGNDEGPTAGAVGYFSMPGTKLRRVRN